MARNHGCIQHKKKPRPVIVHRRTQTQLKRMHEQRCIYVYTRNNRWKGMQEKYLSTCRSSIWYLASQHYHHIYSKKNKICRHATHQPTNQPTKHSYESLSICPATVSTVWVRAHRKMHAVHDEARSLLSACMHRTIPIISSKHIYLVNTNWFLISTFSRS